MKFIKAFFQPKIALAIGIFATSISAMAAQTAFRFEEGWYSTAIHEYLIKNGKKGDVIRIWYEYEIRFCDFDKSITHYHIENSKYVSCAYLGYMRDEKTPRPAK